MISDALACRTPRTKKIFEPQHVELPEGDEIRIAGFRFVDRLGMDHIRAPAWIINDFLADEAFAILFGPYGVFKSFVALDLALSIAAGFPDEPTWEIAQPGPVLFAAGEGRSSLARRVAGWESLHFGGQRVNNFVLVDPVPTATVSEDELQAFVDEARRRHPDGYKLTVIDTLGRAMEGADENSQRDAYKLTALVRRLIAGLGGSVLVLHHSGVADASRPRGSSVFAGDADTIIRASRRGKDHIVSLHMTKQKDAPEWEKKKYVKLIEVHLSPEITSLVAVKPAEDECPKGDKFHPTEDDQEFVMGILNKVVIEWLMFDKSKEWSQSALAEAVATDERIEIGSSQLRQRHLKDLREDSSQPASRYYNAGTRKWRYDED